MGKYTNLKELKAKKEAMTTQIKDLEALITFKKPKESLSVITNGYTDKFLKEVPDGEGSVKTQLDTKSIMNGISSNIKDKINSKTIMKVAQTEEGNSLIKNALTLGVVTLITNYAQKSMKSSTWKKKLIGAAIIYVAPIVLRYISKKINEYQKNKTAESMKKLI